MYAITFDLTVKDLKVHYGDPYNGAYDEIRKELEVFGFKNIQGSVYITDGSQESLTKLYKAMNRLSNIPWFKQSVRDIRAFKVEDYSDFTTIVKGNGGDGIL